MRSATYEGGIERALVLPCIGARAWLVQLALVTAAVVLPAIAHLSGAPVRWLLPMHWPIILAGLIYGWRSGLTVGLLAPGTSWLLTGFPLVIMVLPMTVELAIYGLLTGWLRERGWSGFGAVAVALVAGRLFFLATIWLTGVYGDEFFAYVAAAMAPGLAAGAAQVGVLPVVGAWGVKRA